MECVSDTCVDRFILGTGGKCKVCEDYTYPNEQRKKCVAEICTGRSHVDVTGKCSQCEDYKYWDETQKLCISDIDQCDTT